MLSGIKAKVRWRAHKGKAIAVALLVVIGVMIFSGFAGDIARALFYRLPSEGLGAAPYYPGPVSLEERILEADVIARVKLLSVSQGIEALTYTGAENNDWVDATYVASLEFHFEVIEYLKGNGGVEFVGIVYGNEPYESRIGALAFGENLAETRDTFWDDREAIVFLSKGKGVMSTVKERDRYVLGSVGGAGYGPYHDDYSIASRHSKKWLPAADIDGKSAQRFLTGAEQVEGESYSEFTNYRVASSAYNEALGTGGDSSTITLSELNDLIAELEDEVATGDGSEEYRQCIIEKYRWNREVQHHAYAGGYDTESYDHELGSGLPANTVFALGTRPFQPPGNYDPANHEYANPDLEWEGWIEGRDAHFFHVANNKSVIATMRPLPKGEYRFYYNDRNAKYIPCDAYPDVWRTWRELVVYVHAPEGTLHEAFFDPADIDDALGTDGYDGILQPERFETDDGEVLIERIDWQDGQVKIALSPAADLFGRRMDFIALDGSVALRLDFDEDIGFEDEDNTSTFTWGVCEQPWQDGDLLMLRIASGNPTDTIQATNDPECLSAPTEQTPAPTATPEPTATPKPTPEPEPTATPSP